MVYQKTTLISVLEQGGIKLTEEHAQRLKEANGLKDRLVNFFASLYDTSVPNPSVKYLTLNDFVGYAKRTLFLRITLDGGRTDFHMEELGGMCDNSADNVIKINPYRNARRDGRIIAHELGHATLFHTSPSFEPTQNGFGMLGNTGEYHEMIAERFEIDALPFLREIGNIGLVGHFLANVGKKLSSRHRMVERLMKKEGVTMEEFLRQPHKVLARYKADLERYEILV